jgi:hypothetical protein
VDLAVEPLDVRVAAGDLARLPMGLKFGAHQRGVRSRSRSASAAGFSSGRRRSDEQDHGLARATLQARHQALRRSQHREQERSSPSNWNAQCNTQGNFEEYIVETQQSTIISGSPIATRQSSDETKEKVVSGGYGFGALAGAGAVVLGILAIVNILPYWLTAVAALCLGVAFVSESIGLTAKFSQLRRGSRQRTVIGGGLSTELLGGAAGIVLGIIALGGVARGVLIPVSVIVFGGTLMLGTGASYESVALEGDDSSRNDLLYEAAQTSNVARFFVGAGVLTLGILSLIQILPGLLLASIGMLCTGAILALSGSTTGARVARVAMTPAMMTLTQTPAHTS